MHDQVQHLPAAAYVVAPLSKRYGIKQKDERVYNRIPVHCLNAMQQLVSGDITESRTRTIQDPYRSH